MAALYDVDVRTINEHIKKIYSDSELEEDSRACEKTKVFSCVLLFLDATVVIFYKKVYNSPYPIRKVIMESYAAVTAFFCLL